MTDQCACGRPRIGCAYHNPAPDTQYYRIDVISPEGARCDAENAAFGDAHRFGWRCPTCDHRWGQGPAQYWAAPSWCPASQCLARTVRDRRGTMKYYQDLAREHRANPAFARRQQALADYEGALLRILESYPQLQENR